MHVNLVRIGMHRLLKSILLVFGVLSLFCSCSSDGIQKSWTHYENHDSYGERRDLSKIYPYSEYFNKTIYLQRKANLHVRKMLPYLPYSFSINETEIPDNIQYHMASPTIDFPLEKGSPIRIIEIFSASVVYISHDKTKKPSGNNFLTAKVELELPKIFVEYHGLKKTKIIADYIWLIEDNEANFNPYIRRAPWEPDSVPERRYVGVLGDEMEQPDNDKSK